MVTLTSFGCILMIMDISLVQSMTPRDYRASFYIIVFSACGKSFNPILQTVNTLHLLVTQLRITEKELITCHRQMEKQNSPTSLVSSRPRFFSMKNKVFLQLASL